MRKEPVLPKDQQEAPEPAPRSSHPLLHLLLLVLSCVISAHGFFPVPGYQIGFLGFVLLMGYLYPLLLQGLRPRTGFWMGLILLLLMMMVAEAVGLFCYEFQTTGLHFTHGFASDVLLSPVVLISIAGVVLSALTMYLLGWSMLRICLQAFGKLLPPRPKPDKQKKKQDKQAAPPPETAATPDTEE